MNLNKVFLVGRLTRDPQAKSLPSGQQVANFGLATDRFFFNKNREKQQQTEFHNIVMFGKLAEIASQYLTKGSLVLIEGRLQTRSWQDSAGNQKYRTEIVTERMQLGPRSAGKIAPKKEPSSQEEIPVIEEKTEIAPKKEPSSQEEIPVIEEETEIDVKDIPF